MSLNRKRRIFRPAALSLPSLPSPGLLLAALAAISGVSGGAWMMLRPSEAPAQQPVVSRIAADWSQVAVVDGGTLRLRDNVVRLDGIVPAQRGAVCHHLDGTEQDCGAAAANVLAALVREAPLVDCAVRGHDTMGRALAVCDARGMQLNRALVLAGWARAERDEPALRTAEEQARTERLGLWGR
ncbi:MAG: thermonuclease family protein [Acetobacteraceae bacterium]|nr:thermonuclease family protein [Acetobacteraceae bacterium]